MVSKAAVLGFIGILVIELVNAGNNTLIKSRNSDNYYCGNEFTCKYDVAHAIKHVMCRNGLKFSPKCLNGNAEYIPITNEIKELFLDGHNKRRNMVAQGKLVGIFSKRWAARMATLVWDDELEALSVARVLQCTISAEPCLRTKRFKFPVQNFATPKRNVPIKSAVDDTMNYWFDQYKSATTLKWIESFGGKVSRFTFASFAQMIWSNAFVMGCGMVKYKSNYYITCTYNTGRVVGGRVYEVGRTASKCKKGINPKYPGLCSKNEFHTNTCESPVVNKWIQNGKKIGKFSAGK